MSSRYYSPELGRFIQPADVSSLNPSSINGLNLYSYANNNLIGIAYRSSGAGGINGYTLFDKFSSTIGKIFKGLGIVLMINDVFEAGYNSYHDGHSFDQGVLNVGLTAGKKLSYL